MTANDESEVCKLYKKSLENDDVLMIATTVDTGFEWQAADECKEKMQASVNAVKERGKIYFNIREDQFENVQRMRSIDNIFIVGDVQNFTFHGTDKEQDLKLFKDAVDNEMKLDKALDAWKRITGFLGNVYPTVDEYKEAKENHKPTFAPVPAESRGRRRGRDPSCAEENNVLRYRVTCERTGKHSFESTDIAKVVGGELQERYHWLVDLTNYHLEVVCKVIKNEMITHLRITHESKHRRNIASFGPTTLRATICYNMLRLAHPKPGEIIIDPMCGVGSIPIEGALAYLNSYILCGDNHSIAVNRTKANIDASAPKSKIDLLQWSVTGLPLIDSCIDVIVTDMPFGRRSGRMIDNRILYKQLLVELGRIVKTNTGRLVLLTYDKRSFNTALPAAGNLFQVTRMVGVNIGGLQAVVYVLKRTNISYAEFKPKAANHPKYLKNQNSNGTDSNDVKT